MPSSNLQPDTYSCHSRSPRHFLLQPPQVDTIYGSLPLQHQDLVIPPLQLPLQTLPSASTNSTVCLSFSKVAPHIPLSAISAQEFLALASTFTASAYLSPRIYFVLSSGDKRSRMSTLSARPVIVSFPVQRFAGLYAEKSSLALRFIHAWASVHLISSLRMSTSLPKMQYIKNI